MAAVLSWKPAACGALHPALAGPAPGSGGAVSVYARAPLSNPWLGARLPRRARIAGPGAVGRRPSVCVAHAQNDRPNYRPTARVGHDGALDRKNAQGKLEGGDREQGEATTAAKSREMDERDPERKDEAEEGARVEEARERQRHREHAGVRGDEDSTAPGNGIGRANLLSFSVRQSLLAMGSGGKKEAGDGKDTGSGKDKGSGKTKGSGNDGSSTGGDVQEKAAPKEPKGNYVPGIGRIKTLRERTQEKTKRNKEVITKAKATMKARGDARGLDIELWSDEKQRQWEEYTRSRAARKKAEAAQQPRFALEDYADPNETLTAQRVVDPAGPNLRTFQSEEGGILSEAEQQRLQPIAKPPPDAVIHKVGRPYKGEWGINPNSAGWAPGNPDAPDTGSHRGALNKYGEVATKFPYGTWIGEHYESTFEAAPLMNNSPYWSLNHRPTVSQSVTITQHKASNHVKGGERITSSLAGLCNPANKRTPRDGVLEVFKQRPRNRLADDSARSSGVARASYEGQSEEAMFGLEEGRLPDSLNVTRRTRDAAEWMAKDAPAFTEMSFTRGTVSKEYKNAVVDKLAREKLQGIPKGYIRRLGSMTSHHQWSFEAGYIYNGEELEEARAELQQAIEEGEDEAYIRRKQDEVDLLAKRVEQEKRTLPGKMETLTVI